MGGGQGRKKKKDLVKNLDFYCIRCIWRGVNGFSTHFYGGGKRLNTVTIGGEGYRSSMGEG